MITPAALGTLLAEPAPADPLAPVTDERTEYRYYPYPPDPAQQFEAVTYLIGATESKPWLAPWEARLAMEWAVTNMELLAQTIATEGAEAAVKLGRDEAKRRRDIKARVGVALHDIGEALIYWATEDPETRHHVPYPELPEDLKDAVYDWDGDKIPARVMVEWMANGLVNFAADFGLSRADFIAAEMQVYNPEHQIAGTVDAILVLHGYNVCGRAHCHLGAFCPGKGTHAVPDPGNDLVLMVDFKTGATGKPTWLEQLAAYIRMPECRPDKTDNVLHPTPKCAAAAVLHLRPEYPDGYSLQLVSTADDEAAWERFLSSTVTARDRRAARDKPGTVIRPLRKNGTMPGPRLCDLAGESYGRALAPLREAFGATCEIEALTGFTADDLLSNPRKGTGVKGIGPKLLDTIRRMLADHGLHLAGDPAPAPAGGKAA